MQHVANYPTRGHSSVRFHIQCFNGPEMTDGFEDSEEMRLADLIVNTLDLNVRPSELDPEAPLFGEGLGLDSIDILEIALAISQTYGFKLRADDDDNIRIFNSLRSLSRHIQQHRTK